MDNETVGRPMEILLVEDGLLDARTTHAALSRADFPHRLTVVRDGERAGEFLSRSNEFAQAPQPDLILLDLRLPKRDGVDILRMIRDDEQLQATPVVVLTVASDGEQRDECEQIGVEAFIEKPVDLHKFVAVVRQLRNCWRTDMRLPADTDD